MPTLPENLYAAAQVREFDRQAMEQGGIPSRELMQRAGEAAWRIATLQWPAAASILVDRKSVV